MKFVLFVTLIWSILDSGWSITEEDLSRIEAGLAQVQALTKEVQELRLFKAEQQTITKRQEARIIQLEAVCGGNNYKKNDLAQNTTIEERVTILEGEMTIVQNDVLEIKGEVSDVEDQVAFLFDEQVIQDERIFILEQESKDLDTRVEELEANGGGGGNVTALEERVETLEGTAAEHEADIEDLGSSTSNLDGRVETLEGETDELDTRLTATEAQIEDLQATDVELDSRISDLEDGGTGTTNGTTIAFRATMIESDATIAEGSTVIFSTAEVNEANGYDPATGVFTVPSGGDGYYYFATHFTVIASKYAYIDLQVNNVTVSSVYEDNEEVVDSGNGGCNTLVLLSAGDEVKNVYIDGTDAIPFVETWVHVYNGFSGFRI